MIKHSQTYKQINRDPVKEIGLLGAFAWVMLLAFFAYFLRLILMVGCDLPGACALR